jgi:hypothetical protein
MLCGGGSIVKTIFDVNRNMPAQHSLLQAVETATDRHGLFVGVFYPAVEQCRRSGNASLSEKVLRRHLGPLEDSDDPSAPTYLSPKRTGAASDMMAKLLKLANEPLEDAVRKACELVLEPFRPSPDQFAALKDLIDDMWSFDLPEKAARAHSILYVSVVLGLVRDKDL